MSVRRFLIGLLMLVHPTAFAADWPQWHGPNHDARCQETGLLRIWPEGGPGRLWTCDNVGRGHGTVTVAGGVVYVMGERDGRGVLTAVDTAGKLKWRRDYAAEHAGEHPGARGTPTVCDGRVYVMTGTGVVACLDAASGTTQWQVDVVEAFQGRPSTWGFAESLLLCDDRVICTPGGKQTTCVALDRRTGATVWKSKSLDQWAAMCSPILVQRGGTRLIVTLGVREVLGIDARNGQTLWSFPFEDPDHVDDAVNPQSPIYHYGHLFVLSAARNLGGMLLRLATDGKSVERVWQQDRFQGRPGGAVLCDGRIYGATRRNTWICVDWKTGAIRYEERTRLLKEGAVLWADGLLYCYGLNGTLALVRPDPAGFDMISHFSFDEEKESHWAHPVVAGGILYLRHHDKLSAFHVRKP